MDGITLKIKHDVIDKAEEIAKILKRGYDCEIRRDPNGIKIIEVRKTVR